jgi:hypothetical protein
MINSPIPNGEVLFGNTPPWGWGLTKVQQIPFLHFYLFPTVNFEIFSEKIVLILCHSISEGRLEWSISNRKSAINN